ncbi:MAG: M48 family metalloprotease [Candidatus Hodarchaeales archaeon]
MIANLYFRSFLVLGFMYTLVLAIFTLAIFLMGLEPVFYVFAGFLALIFLFLQFLISPWIMDFMLRWIYSLDWIKVEQLPPHLSNFIFEIQKDHKFNFKQVGIIRDNNPNAFVYGHFRKNARLVLTNGILEYLTNEEQQAVVAHECGHVVHRDFVWMTVAAAIPIIAYTVYAGIWWQVRWSRGGGESAQKARTAGLAVAIGALLVYIISGYLVKLLSRVREYYADRFSAEVTGRPDDLGKALVKIAYGMIVSDSELATEQKEGKASGKAVWQNSFHHGVRAMGIFDINSAKAMSMSVQGRGETLNSDSVATAASWDLSHPWAKFIELNSTHPLPAKRLKALDKYAVHVGREPAFPNLGKIKPPESLWDEFIIELFLEYLLPVLIFLLPLSGFLISESVGFNPFFGAAIGMFLITLLWWYRKSVKYPKITEEWPIINVVTPLTDLTKDGYYEASPIRGKQISVTGTVVGRGTPGYFLSEDLVIQDKTGIIRLDYSPILGFMSFFFALFRVPSLMGSQVQVFGWYHRSPGPSIKVWKIMSTERVFHNRWAGLNTFIVLFFLLITFLLALAGLSII